MDGIYRYRPLTMTINRQREKDSLTKANKKRTYRLMQICSLEAVIRRRRKKHQVKKLEF